jgi:hypothetical protein
MLLHLSLGPGNSVMAFIAIGKEGCDSKTQGRHELGPKRVKNGIASISRPMPIGIIVLCFLATTNEFREAFSQTLAIGSSLLLLR